MRAAGNLGPVEEFTLNLGYEASASAEDAVELEEPSADIVDRMFDEAAGVPSERLAPRAVAPPRPSRRRSRRPGGEAPARPPGTFEELLTLKDAPLGGDDTIGRSLELLTIGDAPPEGEETIGASLERIGTEPASDDPPTVPLARQELASPSTTPVSDRMRRQTYTPSGAAPPRSTPKLASPDQLGSGEDPYREPVLAWVATLFGSMFVGAAVVTLVIALVYFF